MNHAGLENREWSKKGMAGEKRDKGEEVKAAPASLLQKVKKEVGGGEYKTNGETLGKEERREKGK